MQQPKTLESLEAELKKLNKALALPNIDEGERNIYRSAIAEIEKRISRLQAQPEQPTAPEPPQPIPVAVRRPVKTPIPSGAAAEPVSITAVATGGARTVEINWGNNNRDILTEGDARSRFTTALRDLAHSRMARMGRFEDITQYITFDRACAYYRALSVFWGSPPTPAQLQIVALSAERRQIFKMIQQQTQTA